MREDMEGLHTYPASGDQRAVLERFVEACVADERVIAAFIGGSFASSRADDFSDLDLYLVTEDEAYSDFFGERQDFMRRLGQPVLLEDFNEYGFDMVVFTFADGVEGELALAGASTFDHIHGGPHKVLVDKSGLLAGKTFPLHTLPEEEQSRTLSRLIYGFWDSLSYFIKVMHRNQLWSAYGSLDQMRMTCLKLARLKHDFTSEQTAYSKVEEIVPEEELLPLATTCCPLEPGAMLDAARVLLLYYQQMAIPLATEHGITRPLDLERVVSSRLDELQPA
jgi:hypothetical protein